MIPLADDDPKPCVLVVEDDDDMRSLLVEALQGDGHYIEFAADGNEALRVIEERLDVPLLLLTDVRMPGPDGMEVLRRLRLRSPHVPVLVLSAFVDDALLARATELGATAVFSKPADLDDVRSAVLIFASAAASRRKTQK